MSATPESTLANAEQRIADLERQLAEFRAEGNEAQRQLAERTIERDEALAQQTATAEVLQVINLSPGDLKPVFDAMLEKAMRLCEAPFGALLRFDGKVFRAIAARDTSGAAAVLGDPVEPDPGSALERLMLGDEVVHIPDVVDTEAYRSGVPSRLKLVEMIGARTALWVALRKNDVLLGDFALYRKEVRPFTDKQIALLQNFAAQAVIAMENARLLSETREALEQQTATAEVLQVINTSPGDLGPVFDAILDKALRLCGAAFGLLFTWHGECFHPVAWRGISCELLAVLREPFRPQPRTLAGRIARGENIVSTADLLEAVSSATRHLNESGIAEAYRNGIARVRALVEFGGARSHIGIALRKDDALLGHLSIYRQEVRPFTDKQIALLQNFAAQAVIAMENARLLGELRERTSDLEQSLEYQTATSDVLKVISRSAFDLQPVLESVLETTIRLCGNDNGEIFRLEDGAYRLAVARGLPLEYVEIERKAVILPGRETLVGRTALEARPVHIYDAWADPDYDAKEEARLGGARTMLGVPLLRDGVPVGVIATSRSVVKPFTDRQIELVRTFAAQAVIAMENARLLGELRQRTDEVAELNRGLEARVAEQVEELGRIGRLKRFLAPQLSQLIVSQGDEKILESHRREIVVVFCDLRGYTAFTETAEPEDQLNFLREYHGTLGPLVSQFEGTLDHFAGDGIMVFFNDPVPCPDPAERAVKMAMAMREEAGKLIAAWRRHGSELGFGAGIAQGYATLGQIGFSDRSGYTAIGTVCNLAARLCAEAKDGQILVSSRIAEAVEAVARLEDLGNLELRGLRRPVAAFNVVQSTRAPDARPNLTVVARGPEA